MVVTPKKHVSLNQGGSPGLRDVMSSLASRCDSYSADSTTEIMARPSANLRIKDFFKKRNFMEKKSKESSQKMPGKAIKYGQSTYRII